MRFRSLKFLILFLLGALSSANFSRAEGTKITPPKPTNGKVEIRGGDFRLESKPVLIAGQGPSNAKITGVIIPDGRRGAVMTTVSRSSRLTVADLVEGKSIGEWKVEGDYVLLDFDAAGMRALVHKTTEARDDSQSRIEIWKLEKGRPVTHQRWSIAQDSMNSQRCLVWGAFVGRGVVATMTTGGIFELWSSETRDRLLYLETSLCAPAVSPTGSHVAIVCDAGVMIYDPVSRSGTVRAVEGIPDQPILSFRGDGKQLALVGNSQVAILDLETGKSRHVVVRGLSPGGPSYEHEVGWRGPKELLVGDQVFDLEEGLPTHRLSRALRPRGTGTMLATAVATRNQKDLYLLATQFPDVKLAAKKGEFAIKKGDAIKIDVTEVEDDYRNTVMDELKKRLKESGYIFDANAKKLLVASVDKTGPEIEYGALDLRDRTTESKTYQLRHARVKFVVGGATLWEDSASIRARTATNLAEDKTLTGNPDYKLYEKVKLPAGVLSANSADVPVPERCLTPKGKWVDADEWAKNRDDMGP